MSRSLLALNVGSASLKAAGYLLSPGTGPRETGRVTVDDLRKDRVDGVSTTSASPAAMLSAVMARLPALREPELIVHRIVHGGDRPTPLALTVSALDELDALSSLAPLHQPPAVALARAAMECWPQSRHYAAFDTSWHLTMPEQHRVLPLPFSLYSRGVRRYGFHGLAFRSAMRQLASLAPEQANGRIVLAHLGGGSSLCAVRDARCVNTTMGMTPLDGIVMSTRSGSLDPGVILHLQRELEIPPADLDRMLWRESGLKGLSGESGDMRVLLASTSQGARRAIEVYVGSIAQGIAAMAASIGGLDVLAFSGGIGMHAPAIRAGVADALAWLGLGIDEEANRQSHAELSPAGAQVRTLVLRVDEEFEMADSVAGRPA